MDSSTFGRVRLRPGTKKAGSRESAEAPSNSSFRATPEEPRLLAFETPDIPTERISERQRHSPNDRSRPSEAASPSSSCFLENHVAQPQLSKETISVVQDGTTGYTTGEKTKTPIGNRSPPLPMTRSRRSQSDTACNSPPKREESSPLRLQQPANSSGLTTSRAWAQSRDERSHSPADVARRARKPETPQPRAKWDSDHALPLAKRTEPAFTLTRGGVAPDVIGARVEGKARTTNSKWLSEGSYPVNKLEQRPSKPYFWQASPQRQRAPLERGRTFFTPPPSPTSLVSTQRSIV